MTVIGCAGTGKSVLINTVVGYTPKMFQDNKRNGIFLRKPKKT
jgi:ABC-type glutathione transport system ATPase component